MALDKVSFSRHRLLYFVMLGMLLFVWFAATGEGLMAAGEGIFHQWQHKTFRSLCHQDPTRSFWINGYPMAVCTRCYGLYSSLGVAWLLLPAAGRLITGLEDIWGKLLITAIGLNIVDLLGNLLGFWENTPASRTLLGIAVGITVVAFLGEEFFLSKYNTSEE